MGRTSTDPGCGERVLGVAGLVRAAARWRRPLFAPVPLSFSPPAPPGARPHPADHVVRDRVPQGDRLDLRQATHQQAHRPPVARLRVDAFGRRRPFLVDRLGLLRRHPLPPRRHRRAVAGLGAWRSTWGPSAWAPGHRRCSPSPGPPTASILVVLREAAVDQDIARARSRIARCTCSTIGTIWPAVAARRSSTSTPTITWLSVAVANWKLYAGRKPPSAIFITVASGSVVEPRALSSSPAFFLASSSGNRSSAAGSARPAPGRTPSGRRLAPVGGGRVVFHLLLEPLDLLLGLVQALLQGRPAAERRGPGGGADPHPVLGDPVQIDQVLVARTATEWVRGRRAVAIGDAEVGEGVVVDGHVADDPPEGVVVRAQPVQRAGAADALDGGVEPDGAEDLGVDGGRPGPPSAARIRS